MLKSQFAEKFYQVSVKTLMRWIKGNEELMESLKKTGYKPTNKILTPLQKRLIREKFF